MDINANYQKVVSHQSMTGNYSSVVLVLIGGLFITLARHWGYYFIGNQPGYFLFGMRLFDPGFINNDWYTWEIFHHHFAFGYFLYIIQWLGPLHITSEIAQFFCMGGLAYGLFIITQRVCKYPRLVYLAMVCWMGIHPTMEIGLGWQQLINGYLQPSELAGALMVLGLGLLLTQRFMASGVALGFAGLFHAACLSSYGPTILAACISSGLWRNRKSIVAFGIPIGVMWGVVAVVVGQALADSAPMDSDTMWILTDFRAPGDFILSKWPVGMTMNWIMWILVGSYALFSSDGTRLRDIRVVFITAILTTLIGILQLTFMQRTSITLMMLWRVSPLPLLLGLIVAVDRSITLTLNPGSMEKKDFLFLICLGVASVVFVMNGWGPGTSIYRFLWLLSIPGSLVVSQIFNHINVGVFTPSRVMVFMFAMIMIVLAYRSYQHSDKHFLHVKPPAASRMEEWVRQNTLPEAVLIVPPDLEATRVGARRAIVVGSSIPSMASDIRNWYRRICDISGIEPTHRIADWGRVEDGYKRLDTTRSRYLKRQYGASYVVTRSNDHVGDLGGLIERYRDDQYQVFEVPG